LAGDGEVMSDIQNVMFIIAMLIAAMIILMNKMMTTTTAKGSVRAIPEGE
jgi:hypothetical protein